LKFLARAKEILRMISPEESRNKEETSSVEMSDDNISDEEVGIYEKGKLINGIPGYLLGIEDFA
jgi:hypothetical protein